MIIYKINISEGKLYVADPNYPNNRTLSGDLSVRTITYKDNNFEPYPSFAKAGDSGILFDQIVYFAKTAHFDWERIGNRYSELENGTVGSDRLPGYELFIKSEDQIVPMIDGMTVKEDSIIFYCDNEQIPLALPGTDKKQGVFVYDKNGNYRGRTNDNGIVRIGAISGQYTIGAYIFSMKNDFGKIDYHFYDFTWIKINLEKPAENYSLLEKNRARMNFIVNTENTKTNDIDGTVNYNKLLEVSSFAIPGGFTGNTFTGNFTLSSTTDTGFGSINATINASGDLITNVEYEYVAKSKNDIYFNNHKTSVKAYNIPFSENKDGKFIFRLGNGSFVCENISYLEDTFETWYLNENRWTTGYSCDENSLIEISFYRE
jgi:hypothetical protein